MFPWSIWCAHTRGDKSTWTFLLLLIRAFDFFKCFIQQFIFYRHYACIHCSFIVLFLTVKKLKMKENIHLCHRGTVRWHSWRRENFWCVRHRTHFVFLKLSNFCFSQCVKVSLSIKYGFALLIPFAHLEDYLISLKSRSYFMASLHWRRNAWLVNVQRNLLIWC